jgi:hypothetical protein
LMTIAVMSSIIGLMLSHRLRAVCASIVAASWASQLLLL